MKKPLLFLAFIGFLVLLYFKLTAYHNPLYVSQQQRILPENKLGSEDLAIKSINERNIKIKNFTCDVDIRAGRMRTTGKLFMEKPRKFRMTINSILGKEMDIGSNDSIFWFWSKRMTPPLLHYANHENLGKSNLKTPLNPNWIMSSLGIGEIEKGQLATIKNFKGIICQKTSANGEEVTILTLFNEKSIAGHYLYDQSGKMTASAEIKTVKNIGEHILPEQILIIWYQEGVSMEWIMRNHQINTGISPANWTMPVMANSIEMGR